MRWQQSRSSRGERPEPELELERLQYEQQFERFDGLWRMLLFQLRGVGLSEPVDRRPTPEEQARDIEAVMDAEGMERAVADFAADGALIASAPTRRTSAPATER